MPPFRAGESPEGKQHGQRDGHVHSQNPALDERLGSAAAWIALPDAEARPYRGPIQGFSVPGILEHVDEIPFG